MKTMALDTVDARRLFKELGSVAAKGWTESKLAARLKQLPAQLEKMNGDSPVGGLSKKMSGLLDDVTEAVKKKVKIVVTGDSDDEEEEEEAVAPKRSKSTKKPAKTSTKKPAKSTKAKPSKASPKASKKSAGTGPRGERGKTNKDKIFKLWLKKPSTKIAEKCHAAVDEAVSLNTIRSWLSGWSRGVGFPSSASEFKSEIKAAMKRAKLLKKKSVASESDDE